MKKYNSIFRHYSCLSFLLIVLFSNLKSQNFNASLNQRFSQSLERELAITDTLVHSSFKPILQRDIKKLSNQTALTPNLEIKKVDSRSFLARKLFFEHLVQLESDDIYLTIDPIFYFEYGKEEESDRSNYFKNTRGFAANLSIGEKVSIYTSFRENQATLPSYLDERTRNSGVAYGQGRYKAFKEDGFDFAMSSAYISYSPTKNINLQFGHGKHFIGQGHRSLLLSDLSFNSPYLRINTEWFKSKLSYQNLYTSFQSLERLDSDAASEELFQRQRGVFHFLEFKPNAKFSIGLFESAISIAKDSTGNIKTPGAYWVPIIFLNSLTNKADEAYGLLGVNTEIRVIKKWLVYGQLAINQSFEGDLAFQIGSKFFPSKHWMVQLEYNSQSNFSNLNYTHYNESLSSPLVFGTDEYIAKAQFSKGRWIPSASFHYQSDVEILFSNAVLSFLINPSYNFTFDAGVQIRNSNIDNNGINSTFFFIGLRTNLQNLYFDY